MISFGANCALLLLNGDGGAPYSSHRSFRHMSPLKSYLSVVNNTSCHTVLLLVGRDAEAVDYENRSASSLELVTLQVIMAHFS
jgi:hypothetical protein